MDFFGSFVIACSMYSRIPMPQIEWTEARMKYAMCFFPLIGLIMGMFLAAVTAVFQILHIGEGSVLWGVAGTILPLIVTGGIHLDGYLDVTDARSSYGDRTKKLEILKDPHVGAFAVIGCGVYLLAYLGFFSILPEYAVGAVGAVYMLTRALSAMALVNFPKAKKDGLAATFSDGAKRRGVTWTMVGYLAVAVVFFLRFYGAALTVLELAAAALAVWHYYRVSMKEFGGITGDLAGYFLQRAELALIAVLAVWYQIEKIALFPLH